MDAKKLDTGPRDAINWLPDEILGKILSLLATKQAVSTSVLSKKWRTLFKLVDTLEFDDSVSGMGEQEASYVFPESFKDLVDRTVALQCDYPIRKLSLKCHVGRDDEQRKACVGRWISNVVGRGVSEVVLRINDRGLHFLSPQLLTCKTLVKLTLGTRLFLGKLPSYVSLPSLKFLFIHSVFFDDFGELSNVLLAGCPVVEALYLNQNGESMPYTISSPTLKRLSVHYEYHFESVISFDLPNLEYLDYSDYALYGYPQVNLESLVEAYLNLDKAEHVESPDVTKLIMGIRNVEILSLSPDSVGVIYSCCKYGLLLPVFNNLVSLSFGTKKTRAWKLLADILKHSPKLETLIIEDLNGYPLDVSMPLNQVKELQILEYGESDDEVKRLKSFLGEESMIEVVFPEV